MSERYRIEVISSHFQNVVTASETVLRVVRLDGCNSTELPRSDLAFTGRV
jgi:hypothetical protein